MENGNFQISDVRLEEIKVIEKSNQKQILTNSNEFKEYLFYILNQVRIPIFMDIRSEDFVWH